MKYKRWSKVAYLISLVDRVLALHAGSRGFDSHRGHMSERFFRSNRPGYPHPVSSELENSGIRVAVGDCSVTERRRWRPPYQTGKTVHVHATHYKYNEDRRTAPDVCGNGSVPLSHSENVVTRIGIHTHLSHNFVVMERKSHVAILSCGGEECRWRGPNKGRRLLYYQRDRRTVPWSATMAPGLSIVKRIEIKTTTYLRISLDTKRSTSPTDQKAPVLLLV